MRSENPASYGDAFAPVYDQWYEGLTDADETVRALAAISAGHTVLELGVGTGRLAIPLCEAGVRVVGIDASAAMLQACRAKPGGHGPTLVRADMAALPLMGRFTTVFVAFNTLFNLATPGSQQACIEAVADVLAPGGSFVVEAFVPSEEPAHREYEETARDDGAGGRIVRTAVRDPHDQTVRGVHIHTDAAGKVRRLPWAIRYLHPAQLDRVCAAAGLILAERWSDWAGGAFDETSSERHISRYRRS